MRSGFAHLRRRYARATLRASLTAGALVFVVLSLPLVFGLAYYGLDLTRIDLGILCAFERQLADGSGLWLSSTLGNGAPFFARPEVGLFYPPRWLALLLPPDIGASLGAIFHLSVAAAATTWLARTSGLRPWLAGAAGLCFALSGTALDLILHSHYVVAAAWLPLAWASSRRLLTPRGRAGHAVVLGVALSLCLLGGEPQAFVIASALASLEIVRLLLRWRRRALLAALRPALIIIAAFAVGMAQWSSTLAELSITGRDGVLSQADAMVWPFLPVTWPGVLWPGWLHEAVWPSLTLWSVHVGDVNATLPWNPQPYVGSLFVALAICGVFVRRARLPAGVMVVAVLLALGDQVPLLPLLTEMVPPLGLFRYPAKYLVVATLAATLVVALFAHTLARSPNARRRLLWAGGGLLLLQLATLAALSIAADPLNRIAAGMPVIEAMDNLPLLADALRLSVLHSLVPLAAALVIVLRVPRLRAALLGLVVIDLLVALPSSTRFGPTLQDLHSPVARIAPDAVLCVEPSLGDALFVTDLGYSSWGKFSYIRGMPFAELNACDGLAMAVPYSPLVTTMTERLQRGLTHRRAAAARALGCTHLVAPKPPVDGTVTVVSRDQAWWHAYERLYRARLYAIDDPVPRVFVARAPQLVGGHEEALVGALSRTRDATGALAVVDDPTGREPGPLPSGLGVVDVTVAWSVQHRATVSAGGGGGAVIGLRTPFQVGWSAHQGDTPLPVVRVAGQHLAAVVKDVGRGPVSFIYAPPRLALGLVLAALGALAIATCALWQRRSPFLANPGRIGHDRAESEVADHR